MNFPSNKLFDLNGTSMIEKLGCSENIQNFTFYVYHVICGKVGPGFLFATGAPVVAFLVLLGVIPKYLVLLSLILLLPAHIFVQLTYDLSRLRRLMTNFEFLF